MIPGIAELEEENRAKDTSIKKLEEDVAKYNTSIKKLGEEVAEKDQLITRLSRDAVSLRAFADQCQAKLKKHKSFLSSLREDLKHAERKVADLDQRRKKWKERALQGHKTTAASRSSFEPSLALRRRRIAPLAMMLEPYCMASCSLHALGTMPMSIFDVSEMVNPILLYSLL